MLLLIPNGVIRAFCLEVNLFAGNEWIDSTAAGEAVIEEPLPWDMPVNVSLSMQMQMAETIGLFWVQLSFSRIAAHMTGLQQQDQSRTACVIGMPAATRCPLIKLHAFRFHQ